MAAEAQASAVGPGDTSIRKRVFARLICNALTDIKMVPVFSCCIASGPHLIGYNAYALSNAFQSFGLLLTRIFGR